MAPTPLSLATQTLDNTVGAILLGAVIASMLFGITTLQTYWYYHSYHDDSRLHKCSVAALWILDALHLALVLHAVYEYNVTGFGDITVLKHITWSIKLQLSINVIIVLMVHSLYALRVWLLGGYHHGFLGYIVAFVVTAGFGVGAVLAYKVFITHTFVELEHVAWAINSALATSTIIDFVIASAMCFYLRKSKGSIPSLNTRISTIIQYTLSSGLLTTACSLSAMFSYILLPNTFIFLALEFILTELYVGSFIAMLNSRERQAPGTSYLDGYTTPNSPSWHTPIKLRTPSGLRSPSSSSPASRAIPLPTSPLRSTTTLTHDTS